jgi:hypothetical protein
VKRIALPIALALLLSACATPDRAGVRNPEFFRQVATQSSLESTRPAAEVARCFEEQAALLPMTSFVRDEAAGVTTYRLRGFGYTFEEIDFQTVASGSRMTIFIAPNVNAKWREDFERDRRTPLEACAATDD